MPPRLRKMESIHDTLLCAMQTAMSVLRILPAIAVLNGVAFAQPYPDAQMAPTPGWAGPVFRLSQAYPKTRPNPGPQPWKQYDFRTQWREYLNAVLHYCYEGNAEVDWVGQKNTVRTWYNAPWLHWGRNGREFVHGLTYERVALEGELAPSQTSKFQDWAVGFYNSLGGWVIGRVWRDPDHPNADAALFPDGTVSFKLLFTQATVEQVPYLKNAFEWDAYHYKDLSIPTNPRGIRQIAKVRLLQLDVAVRDSRADSTTGWVFGTFVYNGDAQGNTPWERMVPVGLMWGNDPGVTRDMVVAGTKLKETIINDASILPKEHLGWAGRLNGPVDNPISSCLSCHSTAQSPAAAPVIPPSSVTQGSAEWMKWFRNVKAGEPFTQGDASIRSLDYSLQLGSGIQNFLEWKDLVATRGGVINSPPPPDKGVKTLGFTTSSLPGPPAKRTTYPVT